METRDVPGKGLGVIATRDFDVGEIVSSEPAPVALALGLDQLARRCARCARSLAAAGEDAVAPCPARCGVHYCSARCKKDDQNAHGAGGECAFLRVLGRDPKPGVKVPRSWRHLADEARLVMRCRADADAKNVHDGHHPGDMIEEGCGGGGVADGSRPPLSCLDVNETRGGGGVRSESGWDDRARVATRTLRKIAEVADAGFCAASLTRTYDKAELEREAREMKLRREKSGGEAAEDAAVVVCPPVVDVEDSREEDDDEDDEDDEDEDEEALATAIARLELTMDPWWITTRTVFANAYDVSQWETRLAAPPPGNDAPESGGVFGGVPREERVGGAVYAKLSRFNHSCAPNCTWHFAPPGSADSPVSVTVKAIRPIKKGDEATVCYLDASGGRDARRRRLWAEYRFACECDRCQRLIREGEENPDDVAKSLPHDWFLSAAGTCETCGGWLAKVGVETPEDEKNFPLEDALRCVHGCAPSPAAAVAASDAVRALVALVHEARAVIFDDSGPEPSSGAERVTAATRAFRRRLREAEALDARVHAFHATRLEAHELLAVALSIAAKANMFENNNNNNGKEVGNTLDVTMRPLASALGFALARAAALDALAAGEPACTDAAARAWMEVNERALWCAQACCLGGEEKNDGGGDDGAALPLGDEDVVAAWRACCGGDPALEEVSAGIESWVFGTARGGGGGGGGGVGGRRLDVVFARASERALTRALTLRPELGAHLRGAAETPV